MSDPVAMNEVKIQVPAEAQALFNGLEKFVETAGQALKDGFQAGQDIPVILISAMNDLIPAIKAASEVKADIQAAPVETLYLAGKAAQGIIKAL